MIKRISILGCGWLGLPLGKFFLEKGFFVKGSTTSVDKINLLKENGIEAYNVILNPDLRTKKFVEFLESDLLIIDIPPGNSSEKVLYHKSQMEVIFDYVKKSPIQKIIYVSSTSVYGEECGIVKEDSLTNPITPGGKACKSAEDFLMKTLKENLTIIRFGGLIGGDRHPGRFLTFKKVFDDGNRPVNLIHKDDCINIIYNVISKNMFGEIYNGVCTVHPTKEEFYTLAAEKLGIPKPQFTNSDSKKFKIVSNQKVKEKLNYQFVFDNPFKMLEGN